MERLAFAHPLYLWGLAATALPIIVHLFNRRRPRPLAFGAIEFVLRSQRQKARKLRLRQLLLLALRCLLIAGIAAALARPSLAPKGGLSTTPSGPQATALVLDASLSMRYRLGNSTLFERARAEALAALDRLNPDEPATVGLCAGSGGFLGGSLVAPSFDRAAARHTLQAAQPSYLGSDLTGCLAGAARALGESPVAGKRIIAFSDLAAHSIRLDAPPPLVPAPASAGTGAPPIRPAVVLVDAARGEELPNAAVVATAVQPAPKLGPRGYEVVATIANHGAAPLVGAPVSLRIGDQQLAKGFADVAAHGAARKILGAVLPAGPSSGRIELARTEARGLDEDDAQDFTVQVPRDVKALIVDGAPSALKTRDEAWFVEAALGPTRTGGRIAAQTLDADAAEGRSLDDLDVVLLLDVAAPKRAFADKLRAFVQRGGGLLIFLGDHVDPDAYNDSFGALLPRPLHLLKSAAEPGKDEAQDRAARFGLVEWTHPIFRIFTTQDRDGLSATRTWRYALLKPDAGGQTRTLASFDDGAPALVEGRLGSGRVLLCTTSASANWTEWPIRVSFLPVLQQSVAFLAGALEERGSLPVQVGDERVLVAPQGMRVAQVLGPDGKEAPLRREKASLRAVPTDIAPRARLAAPAPAPNRPTMVGSGSVRAADPAAAAALGAAGSAAGGAVVSVAELPPPSDPGGESGEQAVVLATLPGTYRVQVEPLSGGAGKRDRHEEPALAFAARLDPKESDLRRVDEAELKAQLGGAGSAQVAASAQDAQGPRGTPLWGALLLLGVLALLGEGALTRR